MTEMTRARNSLIDLAETPYYHVINRCVRRSYLCGEDRFTGKNYDHRRQLLIDRFKLLSQVYSIDIAAYAVMSNQYHLVLHVDKRRALKWSRDEVISRWYKLFNGNILVDEYLKGKVQPSQQLDTVINISERWRARLHDISWFMKSLNEFIARSSNKEDDCTGKFWEGRFKSQALLDNNALLSCMAYVDLNPVRAGECHSLLTSDFTSIQERIIQHSAHKKNINNPKANHDFSIQQQPESLLSFIGADNSDDGIPFGLKDYLELVDWSGRHIDLLKEGYITANEPKIIDALQIDEDEWIESVLNFRRQYGSFAGSQNALRHFALAHGHSWHKGTG